MKLALVNTRLKDFYDLWIILGTHKVNPDSLKKAVIEVFKNRKTLFKRPIAFTSAFYDSKEVRKRWDNFLSSIGKEPVPFENVIRDLVIHLDPLF